MKYNEALCIARKYELYFQLYCKRIEIAGSIRRKKSEVRDIELVVIPDTYHLEQFFIETYKLKLLKNGSKYKQIMLPEAIKLDLFICSPETFGMNYLIRTGSAEYIRKFMIEIRKQGYCSKDARLYKMQERCDMEEDNEPLSTPEEIDVYSTVGIDWVAPEKRI